MLIEGFFAKRIVSIYCFLKVWCPVFEDTSSSLSKLRVLPSCWPLPGVARGQEQRQLAGPMPALPMQTAADRSLHCLLTPGLLPSFLQAVCCCWLVRHHSPPGFGEQQFFSTRGHRLAQLLQMVKMRGKDREVAAKGRVIYRGGWESRTQEQPGGLRNPE